MILELKNRYKNRFSAARLLAKRLEKYQGKPKTLVLAIPKGALEIGSLLAKELTLALDVVLVKKIPAPGSHELAIGAIGLDGTTVLNKKIVQKMGVGSTYISVQKNKLLKNLRLQEKAYRDLTPAHPIKEQTVLLVDDGIATGLTAKAAIGAIKKYKPAKIILVTPVIAKSAFNELSGEVDEVVALLVDPGMLAVGLYYQDFPQLTNQQALDLFSKVPHVDR